MCVVEQSRSRQFAGVGSKAERDGERGDANEVPRPGTGERGVHPT